MKDTARADAACNSHSGTVMNRLLLRVLNSLSLAKYSFAFLQPAGKDQTVSVGNCNPNRNRSYCEYNKKTS
jgi:hypothetical protein